MQENKAIINSISKKITVLKRSLTIDSINQKKVIKELVATYKRLLEYSPDTILYKKELNHYLQIDDDNNNLRYRSSNDYFELIQKELNNEYTHTCIKFNNDDKIEINILSEIEILFDLRDGIENVFETLKRHIGKNDIFIEYKGKLDNPFFINFEEYASEKAICLRPIFTKNNKIYYYGGKEYERVLVAIDSIDSYSKENGTNFNASQYKKRK